MRSSRSRLLALPLVAVVACQLLRAPLVPFIGPQTSPVQMFSFLAVFIAGWAGGFWAGLIATALSIAAGYIGFMAQVGGPLTIADGFRIGLFVAVSIIFSLMSESHLRTERRLGLQRDALEKEENRRTAADAEAKRAAANLRHFAFLVENASDFIGMCDLEFRPFFLNKAGAGSVGLPELSDQRDTHVFDFFFPDDHPFLKNEFFPKVLKDGHASTEIRFKHFKTGEPTWMEYSVMRMDDVDGRPIGYATISRDLSERKRAEDLLRQIACEKEQSLARFRELADSMPQIVWSSGTDGQVDYFNHRWYELVGSKTTAENAGLGFVHPDDRAPTAERWRHSLASGEPFEIEHRLMFPTETDYRWFLGRALPVRDAAGALVRWYGTSTDIHDQKLAEAKLAESRERLRAALDASDTGTFRWSLPSNELDWDENLGRLFGLAPGLTARSLSDFIRLVHPDDRSRVTDAGRRSAEEGTDFEEEFRVVWPDGTIRWLYDKGRVYRGADGRPLYMAGACVDVTERRRKEDALVAADRQKDEFLGMLAHELRNPLAPLTYSVAVLERFVTEPAAKRPLDVMSRQVRRMTRLVDDLLDVSRVTQGKIELNRETLDLPLLVSQAVEAIRPTIDRHGHTIDLRIQDHALRISGDAIRLGQVLENLLANAAKYTPPGGSVTVTVRRDRMDAVVGVTDTGVGIAPDMLTRVFDLFVQADTSLDRAEGGLGIGLTLVDRLTRLHGGVVEAHSDGPGRGSEFTVRLPLVETGTLSRSGAPAEAGLVTQEGRRILIVDDNADSAEALAQLLEMNGHTVRIVLDGRVALDGARDFGPDLVLLDIGLPGISGFDVVRQIRSSVDLASLTVVATTGYGREEDRARSLEAGFNHHLTKPVDLNDIEQILAGELRSSVGH